MPTSRVQISWLRTPLNKEEDVAVVTMHFQSTTGGLLDAGPMNSVEAAWGTFWGQMQAYGAPYLLPKEFRWYDQQVWPTKSPLLRVTPWNGSPGVATGAILPPQCACSVTLQTSARPRWGRFYLPWSSSASLDSGSGRINTSHVDQVANTCEAFLATCKTSGAIPVVWSPKGGKGPPPFSAGEVLPVTTVRVDDIVDIIRSRRWQDKPYHKVVTVP